MVTQPARIALAAQAMADFCAQTHRERELVVVHDGDAVFDVELAALTAGWDAAPIRILRQKPGQSLGALRNVTVDAAIGDFVCQWDDDDRYHRERLALQWHAAREANTDFCFLRDQMHWFPARRELFWDDWDREPYPLNVVQGTLLGRRDRMPRYAELARGEDTGLLLEILRRRETITRLHDVGWCYIYVYHGGNAWALEHHAAISRAKAFGLGRLLRHERELRSRLAEYSPGLGDVRMPHETGELLLQDTAAPARHQGAR